MLSIKGLFVLLEQISASLKQRHFKFENLYSTKKKLESTQCRWKNKTREQFLKFFTESLISCKVHLDETRLRLYFTSSNQKRLTGLVSHKSVWQRAYRSSTSSCAKYTGPPSALSTHNSVFTEDNRANLVQELQMQSRKENQEAFQTTE